jgi:hypothetical protein
MKAQQAQRKKMWKVVKDVDDEYSSGEWEDMEVVVENEVMRRVVVLWGWYSGNRIRQGPNQVMKINWLKRGVSLREERMSHINGHIMENLNAMSNRVPTMISLTLRVITKENTLEWLWW